jgi:hypothetical protein
MVSPGWACPLVWDGKLSVSVAATDGPVAYVGDTDNACKGSRNATEVISDRNVRRMKSSPFPEAWRHSLDRVSAAGYPINGGVRNASADRLESKVRLVCPSFAESRLPGR